MASYHCSVKVGGKGRAAAHALYIARAGKYDGRQNGRERYEDLEDRDYGNMPAWAEHDPARFWEAADAHERANGTTYREIEVALPRELDCAQRRDLVEHFIAQEIGDRHAYQWAIHTPKAALEKGAQPHAHIMYSERTRDRIERDPDQYFKRFNAKARERGGCEKDSAGTRERLIATRERWAGLQNQHLARHGHAVRVDHRSFEDRGIDRVPERHLGGAGVRALNAREISDLLASRALEGAHERAQEAVTHGIDVSGDLRAAIAQRARQVQEKLLADQAQARAFAREAAGRFRAELAARDFARQATLDFKHEMGRQSERERERDGPRAVSRDESRTRTNDGQRSVQKNGAELNHEHAPDPIRLRANTSGRLPAPAVNVARQLPERTAGRAASDKSVRPNRDVNQLLAMARDADASSGSPNGITTHAWNTAEPGRAAEPDDRDIARRAQERDRDLDRGR